MFLGVILVVLEVTLKDIRRSSDASRGWTLATYSHPTSVRTANMKVIA